MNERPSGTKMITAAQLEPVELSRVQRAQLLQRATERVVLDWFGTKVAACFDHPAQAAAIRARYASFLAQGDPQLWSCAVRGEDGRPLLWTEPGRAWRWPGLLRKGGKIAFLADAVMQQAYFGDNTAIVSFHAAALQLGDAAFAISAWSTGGKSTTAIACARRGMRVYSDERCVLRDGLVHPFPRAMNVRKEALDLLAMEQVDGDGGIGRRLRRQVGAEWKCVAFEELFGAERRPLPRPLEAVFFIEGKAAEPRVWSQSPERAVAALLHSPLLGPRSALARTAAAVEILQRTRAYGLELGRPDETALLIEHTVRSFKPLVATAKAR